MPHFRLRQTPRNHDNAVQDLSRSFKVTDFSTDRKAMRLSTRQYQKRMHISYRLPDTVDSYADFRCRYGCTSIARYFAETPKQTIAKFGMKKLEFLSYFLSQIVWLHLQPFYSYWLPNRQFSVLESKLPDGFQRWRTNLYQISRHDSTVICAVLV